VTTAIALAMCLAFTLFWADLKISVKASPDVIYVPNDYEKIQWAINNASAGSTIFVSSGIYYEHLTIDKALTLQGENEESIIDGNCTGDVIKVTANNVNVSSFTIQNSGLGFWDSGIHTYHSTYNNISQNAIISNGHGIWLECSDYTTLNKNNISNNQCGIGLSFSNNNTIANNYVYSSDECGIGLDYSSHNILTGNTALNNGYGIWITQHSHNIVFHNNIVNNTVQSHLFNSINIFDNGYEGNYWSDYEELDADQDGIGDIAYIIDANNTDNYPLMGMFSDFKVVWQDQVYHVTTICNSTISAFQFNQEERILSFNVTGPDFTVGFCRITIPKALINETYTVLVDGEQVDVKVLPVSNSTHSFLYFTYIHSTHEVVIIPEFPPTLILILFMITTLIVIIITKKKASRTLH
jgi:parallel beta-helix repeat protein